MLLYLPRAALGWTGQELGVPEARPSLPWAATRGPRRGLATTATMTPKLEGRLGAWAPAPRALATPGGRGWGRKGPVWGVRRPFPPRRGPLSPQALEQGGSPWAMSRHCSSPAGSLSLAMFLEHHVTCRALSGPQDPPMVPPPHNGVLMGPLLVARGLSWAVRPGCMQGSGLLCWSPGAPASDNLTCPGMAVACMARMEQFCRPPAPS